MLVAAAGAGAVEDKAAPNEKAGGAAAGVVNCGFDPMENAGAGAAGAANAGVDDGGAANDGAADEPKTGAEDEPKEGVEDDPNVGAAANEGAANDPNDGAAPAASEPKDGAADADAPNVGAGAPPSFNAVFGAGMLGDGRVLAPPKLKSGFVGAAIEAADGAPLCGGPLGRGCAGIRRVGIELRAAGAWLTIW